LPGACHGKRGGEHCGPGSLVRCVIGQILASAPSCDRGPCSARIPNGGATPGLFGHWACFRDEVYAPVPVFPRNGTSSPGGGFDLLKSQSGAGSRRPWRALPTLIRQRPIATVSGQGAPQEPSKPPRRLFASAHLPNGRFPPPLHRRASCCGHFRSGCHHIRNISEPVRFSMLSKVRPPRGRPKQHQHTSWQPGSPLRRRRRLFRMRCRRPYRHRDVCDRPDHPTARHRCPAMARVDNYRYLL